MITVNNVSKSFGGRKLFDEVNTAFGPGKRFGLTGPNGAGKSTFMKILVGDLDPDSGNLSRPKRLGILRQDHTLFDHMRVIDVVICGNKRLWDSMVEKEQILAKADMTDEDGEKLGELECIVAEEDGYSAEADAAVMLEGLGIVQASHERPLSELKGGFKLRVLLAQALFGNPQALLLDEPTNHLDLESIEWLEDFLIAYNGVLVVISHDRHFLNSVCTHIADIDYETIIQYTGNYDDMVRQKAQIRGQVESSNQKKLEKIKQLQDFVSRFAAGTRSSQAASRKKEIERLRPDEIKRSNIQRPYIKFEFDKPGGREALTVHKLACGYADTRLYGGLHVQVDRGDKVAVIGRNGVGKTTLIETLMGKIPALQGNIKWGHEVNVGYFPQEHEGLIPPGFTVFNWMFEQKPEAGKEGVRSVLGRMLFSGEDGDKPTATLSGGERVRTILARLMLLRHNTLVLDEPTNHMDLEAISSLRDGIQTFPGTCIFVTHDRDLIETVANKIVAIEDGRIDVYPGGWSEYRRAKKG
ncbi:MAG: ATP-binding cassette domain-containing protein [Deltaproteobacteria bacterium]|nr:ATP-binding cassette domain-containing protein [Deltaproteobacteria bacterium]